MKKNKYILITIWAILLFLICNNFAYSQDELLSAEYDVNTNLLTITNKHDYYLFIKQEGCINNFFYNVTSDNKIKELNKFNIVEEGKCYPIGDKMPSIVFKIPKGGIKEGDFISLYLDKNDSKKVNITFIKEVVKNTDTANCKSDKQNNSFKNNWLIYIVAFITLVIICFILYIFTKRYRKKLINKKQLSVFSKNDIIGSDANDDENGKIGLDEVKKDLNNYYVLDARDIYTDTAIQKIYISRNAIKNMYDSFKKFLEFNDRTLETGCYFVGRWEYADSSKLCYNISLEFMVEPGDDVVYGEYALNFGKKIGVVLGNTIFNLQEKTKCNYVHTSWMHSHPGLGLFLSTQDLLVQKQLSYSDAKNRTLAIVIDTNTPSLDTAFFTPKKDGTMNNKAEMTKTYPLDSLYQWSRQSKEESIVFNTIAADNYFKLNINSKNILSLLFSAKAINEMDDILYTNNKGIIGYFEGSSVQTEVNKQPDFVIENCLITHNEKMIGCFIADTISNLEEILGKYYTIINKYSFFIIYISDNEMFVGLKNENGIYVKEKDTLIRFTLDQMKAWTRRKRI
ncbi:MAG: hypothetical protein ACOYO1_00685 [Bacteroidales bacterium]